LLRAEELSIVIDTWVVPGFCQFPPGSQLQPPLPRTIFILHFGEKPGMHHPEQPGANYNVKIPAEISGASGKHILK
jgi:hypothetical protein